MLYTMSNVLKIKCKKYKYAIIIVSIYQMLSIYKYQHRIVLTNSYEHSRIYIYDLQNVVK